MTRYERDRPREAALAGSPARVEKAVLQGTFDI